MRKRGTKTDEGDKIVRRKLSDQVLERLLEMITRREVLPGELMPSERDLMERLESAGRRCARRCNPSTRWVSSAFPTASAPG